MSKHKYSREAPAEFSFYQWRQDMDYTQKEAAFVLGLGTRTITYYEQGRMVNWPVYLACMYIKQNPRQALRMAEDYHEVA